MFYKVGADNEGQLIVIREIISLKQKGKALIYCLIVYICRVLLLKTICINYHHLINSNFHKVHNELAKRCIE